MEHKISFNDFIKKYDSYQSKEAQKKYVESIIITNQYVDYLVKVNYAKNILNTACLNKDGNIHMNSCKKYILYVYTILTLYTYLDISEKEAVLCYDELEKRNLVAYIMDGISKFELTSFDTILNMCTDDLITNNYEIHGFINRKVESYKPLITERLPIILKTLKTYIEQN